ncbi:hypothetical protein [Agromyces larvae]|uniref:LPXTG cell wall anchor domain-containing protein n=1 Tax=Agromyces larvae TaxID=2929802 RepID=A0ABY4BWI7_9MICO|nr:hypothetical protein [Agromyces larvae]UOE43552.1 hypothetical protein MTO99_15440 [Agromyces larvae]
MATSALRLRVGALAAVAGLALAGFAAASPAAAEETPAPTITLDKTSFPAGNWGAGFHVTGTGFVGTGDVSISIGVSYGPQSGDGLYQTTVTPDNAGAIDVQVVPTRDAPVTSETDYPRVGVVASQQLTDTERLVSNSVALTITASDVPAPTATFAQVVSPEQLAAGLTLNYSGFGASEPIYYGFLVIRDGEPINELVGGLQQAVADASGAGALTATIPGAQVGDTLAYYVAGDTTGRSIDEETPVVAAPAAAAPTAGTGLAETGIDLGVGTAAIALLVLGAGSVILVRRRAALAQR